VAVVQGLDFKVVDSVVEAIILLLPAMIANATPVIANGRMPVDMGARFLDGRRLLGDGKTWEGTMAALAAGLISALTLYLVLGAPMILSAGTGAVVGAILGDMAGSFIKRRLGLERGAPAPILDQLDFFAGALLFTAAAGVDWTVRAAIISGAVIAVLHVASNVAAYALGLKRVPW
jgi:CDP-2,3-bis-(O-geranylgeranyl)-sn-glycerol synthase